MATLLSIGEFSQITGLTVKTLRFYHEQSILIPARVDGGSGYRFYEIEQAELANVIRRLRDLEFSVREISEVLADVTEESDMLERLERKHAAIALRLKRDRQTQRSLNELILWIRETRTMMNDTSNQVEIKTVDPMKIAAVRMQAAYRDCGTGFKKIGKAFGRHISGKPMLLHYDSEHKDIADYEACMPVRNGESKGDVTVRELPGGKCLSVIHRGSYDNIGTSYQKIRQAIVDEGHKVLCPSREIYLKGPGMIFKGNPKNYVTEIQMMIGEA